MKDTHKNQFFAGLFCFAQFFNNKQITKKKNENGIQLSEKDEV